MTDPSAGDPPPGPPTAVPLGMADPPPTAADPVCGMTVPVADPPGGSHDHDGTTYHFCAAHCRERFLADPAAYLGEKVAVAEPVPEGTIYTCPMHPQVRQVGPGSCPICGMALEPLTVAADAGPNPELADMTRRFWVATALTIPIVIASGSALCCPSRWWPSRWAGTWWICTRS